MRIVLTLSLSLALAGPALLGQAKRVDDAALKNAANRLPMATG